MKKHSPGSTGWWCSSLSPHASLLLAGWLLVRTEIVPIVVDSGESTSVRESIKPGKPQHFFVF